MHQYSLRFFFSPGSNVCLWAGNEVTQQRWDYPVESSSLPVPENTWRYALYLCAWYDTSIDWSYPPNPSRWDISEQKLFNAACQQFLLQLGKELGPDFAITDESETA